MAKHTYTITSPEGATRYGAEVGTTLDLDLGVDEKRAVVAAGWVAPEADEPETTTQKEKK
jgi:hypothetical protein